MRNKKANELYSIAKLALFATSYSPLFILIIIKQVYDNWEFFCFGGWNVDAIKCFCSNFLVSAILFIFLLFGIIGCFLFLSRQKEKKGDPVMVTEVNNKNSESIGYIATYIIPFVFQSFNSIYEVFSILFILIIIYSNTNLYKFRQNLGDDFHNNKLKQFEKHFLSSIKIFLSIISSSLSM